MKNETKIMSKIQGLDELDELSFFFEEVTFNLFPFSFSYLYVKTILIRSKVHVEVFVQAFTYIRRPLILKY